MMVLKYQQRLRRARVLKVVFVLLGLLIVFGLRLTSQAQFLEPIETPLPISSENSNQAALKPTADFLKILKELDLCRSVGIAARSIPEVAKCSAPDSPALKHDSEIIEKLLSQQLYLDEFKFEILEVVFMARRLSESSEYVSLRVSDTMRSVELVKETGKVIRQPERKTKQWLIVLVKDAFAPADTDWRFWEVRELDSSFY
jgi:hypothetical protein